MTIHETEQDRTNEMLVALKLSDKWACNMEEMPKLHHFDFKARRQDHLYAIIEIKCRPFHSEKYKTYVIDQWKVDKMMPDANKYGILPIYVSQFTDCTRFCILTGNYPSKLGGPNPPRDENDIKMLYHIPRDDFITLKDFN